jgi:hypothetical protein
MQFVGLAAIALPREWITSISMPWAMTLAIGFLMLFWLLLFAGMLSPIQWMVWRSLNLQLRHLGQNRPLRRAAYLWTAVMGGLFGLLLNMYLVEIVGRTVWPEVFGGPSS